MKYKLNGIDRLIIPKLFAEKGTMLQQTTVKEVNEKLLIKSDEFEEYGLVEDKENETLSWNKDKIKIEKEFDLSKVHIQLLKESVDKKDKDGEINQQILETCQKIKKM